MLDIIYYIRFTTVFHSITNYTIMSLHTIVRYNVLYLYFFFSDIPNDKNSAY